MRRAFTLIELLVVIGIMGLMVTVGVVGIRAGKSRSQLAGATRDILALVRQARAIALITQQPSVITYSNVPLEDENSIRVEVKSEKLFNDGAAAKAEVRTLGGKLVGGASKDEMPGLTEGDAEKTDVEGGETLNDVLSPQLALDIAKGLKLKVEKGEEQAVAVSADGKVYKSAISVFSTLEYVSAKYADKKKDEDEKSKAKSEEPPGGAAEDEMTEPVSVVWQTNGRTDPHTVWIYPDGSLPDKGLSIVIDKFGGCQVSQWAEDER